MVYIPLIYFSILFLYLMKKRGISVCTYAALLYVITSAASILYYESEADTTLESVVSLWPTIEYCVLLTFFIVPLSRFDINKYKYVSFGEMTFLKGLIITYAAITVILLLAYHDDLLLRFVASEVKETKYLINQDYGLGLKSYPRLIQIPLNILMLFGASSFVMIFIIFFSLTYLHLSKSYILLAVIGSFASIVVGILGMDRSKAFFWMIIAGLCVVMFWKKMDKSSKRGITIGGSVLVSLVATYFVFVTFNRFGQEQEESSNAVVSYAGKPYVNFCYFEERFHNPDGITLKYLLPVTHVYVIRDYKNSVHNQQVMTKKTGIDCGTFYSILGDFIISDGLIGPFLITLVFIILSNVFLRKKVTVISFRHFFVSFLVMIIPCVGVITYLYNNQNTTLPIYVMLLLMPLLRDKRKLYL